MYDQIDSGQGPIPLGSTNAGALSGYPWEIFVTPELDLTQPLSGLELVPARPGYAPCLMTGRAIITFVSGTQTSPPTIQAGNNDVHTNFFRQSTNSPSNADVNAANPPSISGGPQTPSTTTTQIANATVLMDIVAGATGTGGFALRGKYVFAVAWLTVDLT